MNKKRGKKYSSKEAKRLDEATERFAQIVVAHIEEKYKKKSSALRRAV